MGSLNALASSWLSVLVYVWEMVLLKNDRHVADPFGVASRLLNFSVFRLPRLRRIKRKRRRRVSQTQPPTPCKNTKTQITLTAYPLVDYRELPPITG